MNLLRGHEQSQETEAGAPFTSPLPQFLPVAASVVVISAGVIAASHLITIVLLGLLSAYSLLPLPRWMMRQLKLKRSASLALTVGLLGTLGLTLIFLLYERALSMRQVLPVYQERFSYLYGHLTAFLTAHGIDIARYTGSKLSTSDEIFKYAQLILPQAGRLFSDGLLVLLLGCIFLVKMTEDADPRRGRVGSDLAYYGGEVQQYIAISATTGAITATANLVLLVAFGVDFPLVWCVLYFFLHFIPNIGFILALVPPAFLALLMLGWKQALLVTGGLILTNTLSDYVLTPLFMKKGVHVTFMEMMLSLLWWGFLLGPAGGILAIPLTLALRKFIARYTAAPEQTCAGT